MSERTQRSCSSGGGKAEVERAAVEGGVTMVEPIGAVPARWGDLASRPTLAAWVAEYAQIEKEYLEMLQGRGIDLAPRSGEAEPCRALRERLAAKGARFCNGGASISCGNLSSACKACATDAGSRTFYLSLACNRHCYFCFNGNQRDFEAHRRLKEHWREELDAFLDGPDPVTHVALTGGEPLLHPDEAVAFFGRVREKAPSAHTRLYTDGDFLYEGMLRRLQAAGLTELRLSVKPDEPGAAAEACRRLKLAKRFVPQVMVEMPVIPGTEEEMRELLRALDRIGAFGINLLEFGYPMGDWAPFAGRGFRIANPPFAVTYDYSYAGGLPVAGSERACLELVEFALDEGLSLGVHYCSLENKNRTQIYQQNTRAALDESLWELDEEDFFWKTAKVFDGDVPRAVARLETLGAPWAQDADEASIQFHPKYAALVAGGEDGEGEPLVALSFNVIEGADADLVVRELGLFPFTSLYDADQCASAGKQS